MVKGPGNSKYVKRMNRMAVLNIIKQSEPISRQELAALTGLTPPAITGIIRELMDGGFVREVGLGESQGGRKPVKLMFNPEAGYVIGLEVTRYETYLAIADLKNDPTDRKVVPIDMSEPECGVAGLVEVVRQTVNAEWHQKKKFLAVGIAFPGLLHARQGVVKRSVNLGLSWDDFPLKEMLEQEISLPIYIENNSNASVLAERWFGGGTACRDLSYINLGEGVSAGIIIDDRIVQGAQGYAGEIGHIVMQEEGSLCNCGNRGCLETICGIPALVRKANSELALVAAADPLKAIWLERKRVNIDDILYCAAQPDTYASRLLLDTGKYVGLAVANVVNMYNPAAVFIGGKVASAGGVFLDVLQQTVHSHAFPKIAKDTAITLSTLGAEAGVLGACALALRQLLHCSQSAMLEDVVGNGLGDR